MRRSDVLDGLIRKSSISKQAIREMHKRAFPAHFVEKELKEFEAYTQNQLDYRKLVESFLESERNKKIDQIIEGFNKVKKTDYQGSEMNRIVRSKFSADPLCAVGSVERIPGGRFNFGKSTRFVTNYFYALYVASNYETAFEESFHSEDESIGDFSSFKVNIKLDSYIDLTDDKAYDVFFEAIKDIKLPEDFRRLASDKGVEPATLACSATALKQSIMTPNFKSWDTWIDCFAPSQWFGYYVQQAEINAIKYPSVRKNGGINFAIFMQNIEGSNSQITLSRPNEWPTVYENRKVINSSSFEEFTRKYIV